MSMNRENFGKVNIGRGLWLPLGRAKSEMPWRCQTGNWVCRACMQKPSRWQRSQYGSKHLGKEEPSPGYAPPDGWTVILMPPLLSQSEQNLREQTVPPALSLFRVSPAPIFIALLLLQKKPFLGSPTCPQIHQARQCGEGTGSRQASQQAVGQDVCTNASWHHLS